VRQWRVGTLSMGIILVALGSIMLYSQIAGVQSLGLILKWWPIILVLLGVEILVYIFLSKQEQPKVKFDIFSIFIISFIMLAGVGVYAITSVVQYAKDNVSILPSIDIYKNESRFEKYMTVDLGAKDTLKIKNTSGNVEVVKGDSDKIEINADIIIRNNDEEHAAEISDDIIEIINTDIITVYSKTNQYTSKNGSIGSIRVNYRIKVPEKINVEIDNKFGDIDVSGILLKASITNSHGEIIVDNIGQDLYIENSFGDVEISNVKAYTKVKNSHGEIKAFHVGGDLVVENKMGDIELEGISGNVDVVDEHGSIRIKNVGKKVKAQNQFGDIKISGVGSSVELTGQNGEIVLENKDLIKNDVNISNKFGKIALKLAAEQQGSFDIKTEFGSIKSDFDIIVNEDLNKQRAKNTIGNGDISIKVENRNGDINIRKFQDSY